MPLLNWTRELFSSPAPPNRKPSPRPRLRPAFEVLEDRTTPAIFSAAGSDLLLSGFLSGEQISVVASGANQISITLSGDTWAGVNGSPAGVSGNGNATVVINSSTFTGAIRFSDSAGSQTLNFNGGGLFTHQNTFSVEWLTGADAVQFQSGALTSAAGLAINATGTGSVVNFSQNVTTAGSQTYNVAAALLANVTLTSNGGDIFFNQTLNGGFALAVNAGGTTAFNGVVGTTPLANLTTDAAGDTQIGAIVTTTDGQTFGDAVTLSGNALLTSTGGGDISFVQVDGNFSLAVNTTGTTTFDGAVGGATPLAGLATDAGGTTRINSSVNTGAAAQTYNDDVSLGQSTLTLTGDVAFNGGLILGDTATTATSTLQVTGNLSFANTASVTGTFAGIAPAQFGHITVSGDTIYGNATLVLNSSGGFTPAAGNGFSVVTSGSGSGEFANAPAPGPVVLNGVGYLVSYAGGDFILTVPTPTPSGPSTATISGTVFLDINQNGVFDAGESGSAGRTVYLDANSHGVLDSGEVTALTGADGAYAFRDVGNGSYVVRLVLSNPTFTATGPTNFSITLTGTDQTGLSFGVVSFQPAAPVQPTSDLYGSGTNPDANTAYVRGLYHAILGRDADAGGLADWTALLAAGVSRTQVAQSIYTSAEHRGQQVDAYYLSYLGRSSDAAGRQGWVDAFLSGADETAVVQGFLASAEFQSAYPSAEAFVRELYFRILGRSAADVELSPWLDQLAAGVARGPIVEQFLRSDEAARLAVGGYYSAYLHRAADAGAESWIAALRNGSATLGQVAVGIVSDPGNEFFNNGQATVG